MIVLNKLAIMYLLTFLFTLQNYMGQKIHPLGFRVGITKQHQSEWFARFHKHQYSQAIVEDRLIRETLMSLFPELLNPMMKKVKKRDTNQNVLPKITHIKIERGLIPYEIGIQIHAGNCELLKAAIDNLKLNENLINNLQKTRSYLVDLRLKLKDLLQLKQTIVKTRRRQFGVQANNSLKVQKLTQRRWKKRQNIVRRFQQRLTTNVLLTKTGKKIIRKLQENSRVKTRNTTKFTQNFDKFKSARQNIGLTTSNSLNLILNKINKKFLKHLKENLKYWNDYMESYRDEQIKKYGQLKYAPLGYNRKWSLNRIEVLKKQPLPILNKLLKSLQAQAINNLEILRKEFIALGNVSKTQSFNYYQMIVFIKSLKQVFKDLKKEQKLQLYRRSLYGIVNTNLENVEKIEKSILSLSEKAIQNKLNNIEDECRKVRFIEYLRDIVKKHRTKNIYFYLSTISDSRKNLKKIKQFTKQHSSFLFGLDLYGLKKILAEKQSDSLTLQVKNRVEKVLKQSARKSEFEKTLQDVFVEQIQKQRTMYNDNLTLTPKISIKFYSVKPKTLESKASLIAESIVDDLEKRKAFRGVIKKAKEELMAKSSVKGVKIQVAGRLNGAEIARTEWVRAGRVPLQTLKANIDYSYRTANTIYGIIGVKVWMYKGSTTPRKKTRVMPLLAKK
jgi:ribosomal protein S3